MSQLCISALGAVDPRWVEEAARCVRTELGLAVSVLPPLEEPSGAFDAKRQQYSAVAFLSELVRSTPPPPARLLGLTGRDIFIPMLTFLFGQAQLGGAVAMVSLARLDPVFYGLPADPALLAERLRKETIHELGHTYGLVHCQSRDCAMSLSTSILNVDIKRDAYCPGCRQLFDERLAALSFEDQR